MLSTRGCGVLLHPSSLPGSGGIGSIGTDARRFVDLLSAMGMSYWQMLPLVPPSCGNSPYSGLSAFAGNPLLIDIEQMVEEGDLPAEIVQTHAPGNRINFVEVCSTRLKLLHQAGITFLAGETSSRKQDFWNFCDTTPWLHDYALFMSLKTRYSEKRWDKWPKDMALISKNMYEKLSVELGEEIGIQKYVQWQFFRQWKSLRTYAAEKNIKLIGDIPLFVALDSADVWNNRDLFLLDTKGKPKVVAGVPPDYFSVNGQLWGNPLYDWDAHRAQGYSWWMQRFRTMFDLFDIVRIDHFRGFEAAWQVPSTHRNAQKGQWVKGPGMHFFDSIIASLGELPIIAEDLGVITPDVEALRDHYGFFGMKILQFAFDSGSKNPYLPHNHVKNSVVYTGTHDNDTSLGWYHSLSDVRRTAVHDYLGCTGDNIVSDLLRVALMSVASTTIIPFQDLLRLGSDARMNLPGMAFGNWEWRFEWGMISSDMAADVRLQLERYDRIR